MYLTKIVFRMYEEMSQFKISKTIKVNRRSDRTAIWKCAQEHRKSCAGHTALPARKKR